MIWIRSTYSEEWGHLFSIQHDSKGRDLWVVEYADGRTDVWPSWGDPTDYDVRIQIEAPEDYYHGNQDIEASADAGAGPAPVSDHSFFSWGRKSGGC